MISFLGLLNGTIINEINSTSSNTSVLISTTPPNIPNNISNINDPFNMSTDSGIIEITTTDYPETNFDTFGSQVSILSYYCTILESIIHDCVTNRLLGVIVILSIVIVIEQNMLQIL